MIGGKKIAKTNFGQLGNGPTGNCRRCRICGKELAAQSESKDKIGSVLYQYTMIFLALSLAPALIIGFSGRPVSGFGFHGRSKLLSC